MSIFKTTPCEIYIKHQHNHPVKCADALRHRRPTGETKEAFLLLFKKGHSPSSALRSLKFDLQLKYGDDYYKYASDGAVCPSYYWGFNLYRQVFKKNYGVPDGAEMINSLKSLVDEYNSACGSIFEKLLDDENDLIVALCSPLMKRVHQYLRSSSEMVFVDSGGNMDRHNTRVFLFVTFSVAGALPLAIVMTSSETINVLQKSFELLKCILPDCAFYGRGNRGPKLFMTDDSDSLRPALKLCFIAKDLILLLCKFHILQAFWRFVMDSDHGVPKTDRPELYFIFKKLVNITDAQAFNQNYDEVLASPIMTKYNTVKKYLEDKRERSSEWAMAFRENLLTRGNRTNNFNEACMRILKELLERVKAYSPVQLFDCLTQSLEAYFKRRIADCLCNRICNYTSSRFFVSEEKLKTLSFIKESEDIYTVTNSKTRKVYKVDLSIDVCSCPVGINGAPCKHQFLVVKSSGRNSSQFLSFNDAASKLVLHKIMSGSCDVPDGWYENLKRDELGQNSNYSDAISVCGVSSNVPEHDDSNNVSCSEPGIIQEVNNFDVDVKVEECKENLKQMFEDMVHRLEKRPDVYLPAYQSFLRRYGECTTDNSHISAMFTFNRNRESYALRTSKKIPVQPTAVGRRTVFLGGRHLKMTGRPPKRFRVDEHAYSQAKKANKPSHSVLPTKRFRAPHDLQHCVDLNVGLGKTHSAK